MHRAWIRGFLIAVCILSLHVPLAATAQDGSVPPADQQPSSETGVAEVPIESPVPSGEPVPQDAAPTSTTSAQQTATSSPAQEVSSSPPIPAEMVYYPKPASPMGGELLAHSVSVENVSASKSSRLNPWWPLLFVLALLPFGFLAAKVFKNKPEKTKESDKRCFDIKRLLEEKLEELTDLRAMAESKIKKVAKEQVSEAVQGTVTGDALVRMEKLESEYNRLKKLYEECTIDAEQYKYKGVLTRNSLRDTNVLEKVKIVQTRGGGDRVLHDIRLGAGQVEEIRKQMADGPWYFHVWKPGTNEVTVAFKNRVFEIIASDRATWSDAIAYGRSLGIQEGKLDFRME